MNFVHTTRCYILLENGVDPDVLSKNYKKKFQGLISENLYDVVFVESTQIIKPRQLIASSTQTDVLNAQ